MKKTTLERVRQVGRSYDCRYPAQPRARELWQGSPWRAFRALSGR